MLKIYRHGRRVAAVASLTLTAAAAGVWSAAWATAVNRAPSPHGGFLTPVPDTAVAASTRWRSDATVAASTRWRSDTAVAGTTRWRSNEAVAGTTRWRSD